MTPPFHATFSLLLPALFLAACKATGVEEAASVTTPIPAAVPVAMAVADFPELGLMRTDHVFTGKVSWYSVKTNGGSRTASGEKLTDSGATAAHPSLPFGTMVEVTNLANEKTAVLKITDRGPYTHGRVLDVAIGAARDLDFVGRGVAECRVQVLRPLGPE